MFKEPRPMQEIHEIQERIYEEEKNLMDEEKLNRLHKEAEEVKRRWGLKLRSIVTSLPRAI